MTIKEFAQLCNCTTQTLRYYDRIDLLKPVKVDPWSGYRYYEPSQAVAFVKIKNLQAADFSIQEIKSLLTQSDPQIYAAFDRKITEQKQKLERILEIQKSYLAEKNTMENIIASMTDYLLSQCSHPEVLTEFGLSPSDAPAILALLKDYLNQNACKEVPEGEIHMTINDEVIQGESAILNRIHSLTKENLEDSITLDTGFGHYAETSGEEDPDFQDYETMMERHGWHHVYDFFDDLPQLEQGKTYCLWLRVADPAYRDDLSFSLFLIGAVLYTQKLDGVIINGALSPSEDGMNTFKLLRKLI